MKLKFTYLFFIALFAWISLKSDKGGRGTNTQSCGGGSCHSTGTGSTVIDSISLVLKATNTPVSQYVAGQRYRLIFYGRNTGSTTYPKFGFQLSHGGKGTYSGAPASTAFNTSFWNHNTQVTSILPIPNRFVDTCTWQAPATGAGTVTFTMQLNAVNNDNALTSDDPTTSPYTKTYTEFLNAGVIISKPGGPGQPCPGVSTTYTATPQNGGSTPTYQWTVNSANVGTGGTTYTATLNPNDTVRCIMTSSQSGVGNNPATSNSFIVSTGFNNVDTITAPTTTVCAGDSVIFTSTPAAGSNFPQYRWYVNKTQVQGPGVAAPNNVSLATYKKVGFAAGDSIWCSVQVFNACAFPPTDTSNYIKMTVNPSPVVSGFSNQTVCNGDSSVATNWSSSMSGTSYTWTNSNPAIGLPASGSGQIGKFLATNPGTTPIVGTITINSFAGGCSGVRRTFTITVPPSAVVRKPTTTRFCEGAASTLFLQTNPFSGTVVNWTNDNPSIGIAGSGTGATINFTASCGSGDSAIANITANATMGGCKGPDSVFQIIVYKKPIINQPSDVTVCQKETIPASSFSSNVSSATYAWTNSNTAIGLAASGTGDYSAVTGNTAGTATINVTATNRSCASAPVSYTIRVNAPSVPTIQISTSDTLVCAGGSAIFRSTNTNGGSAPSYQWTLNNLPVGGDVDTLVLTNVNPGDSIKCDMISNSNCVTSTTAASNMIRLGIQQNVVPKVVLSSTRDTVCEGNPLTINASVTNGGIAPKFRWFINGIEKPGYTTNSFLSTGWVDKDKIYCELTSDIICANPKTAKSAEKEIRVFKIYNVAIDMTKDKIKICSDDMVTFTLAAKGGSNTPKVVWKLNGQEISTNPSFVTTSIFSEYDVVSVDYHSGYVCQMPSVIPTRYLAVDSVLQGPIADYSPNKYISFCEGDSGLVKVFNGQPQYIYSWSNGFSGDSFYSKESQSYLLTITESNNVCKRVYGPLTTYKEPKPFKPFVEKIDRDSNMMLASLSDNYQWQLNKQDIFGAAQRKYAFVLAGLYRVKTVNLAGCIAYSDELDPFKFGAGLGNTILTDDIRVYPNPTSGKFYIESSRKAINHVAVYNLLGEKVYESAGALKNREVDIQDRANGIYLLRMDLGSDSYYQRIELK